MHLINKNIWVAQPYYFINKRQMRLVDFLDDPINIVRESGKILLFHGTGNIFRNTSLLQFFYAVVILLLCIL